MWQERGEHRRAGVVEFWMVTEFEGMPAEAAVFVWADDADEARSMVKQKVGKGGRKCFELAAEKGVVALVGIGAPVRR